MAILPDQHASLEQPRSNEARDTPDGQTESAAAKSSFEGNNPAYSKRAATKLAPENGHRSDAAKTSPSPTGRTEYSIDPLSHHILKRTNTENTIPLKLQRPTLPTDNKSNTDIDTPPSVDEEGLPRRRSAVGDSLRGDLQNKDKKKGVSTSFLSRFHIIGNKKADHFEGADGDESDPHDKRTEGMNADVFSSSIGAIGYIPQYKDPTYIKVRAHNKKEREFNRMFLAQELQGTDQFATGDSQSEAASPKRSKVNGTVWSTEFSRDGKYLAAAGHDHIVRVWAVISTPEERRKHESEEDASNSHSGGNGQRLSAPVFRSKPIRQFEGHTSDVLDLSWSKNNFLLSSSMDKTVRLWHISRSECLCCFKHKDFVTSIAFHPVDDRFFLAGSLDSTLRLWSIPDKSVAFWNQLPGLITAVAFTPDGKTAIAGIITGLCLFYETEGLKYHTQIHVRSSRGRNAKGSKITGIRSMNHPGEPEGDFKLLITTNDSRVRLYNFRDKSLEMKFKGNSNTCSQIHASFSDDGKYVICGSEDKRAYIWSTCSVDAEMKDKRPLEDFGAHQEIVTTAIFAPVTTRQLLSASEDPLYDLCNPPPVTLLSREESSQPAASEAEEVPKKQEETPAYIARSLHPDGNIIVTADFTGNIKVFRQDCAHQKRKNDQWETASTFSKKIGGGGLLGKSASVKTKNSDRSQVHSRRSSINQSHHPDNRILSWRNSIGSTISSGTTNYANTSAASERSASPSRFSTGGMTLSGSRTSIHSHITGAISAKEARQLQYGTVPTGRGPSSMATKSTRSTSPPPTRGSYFGASASSNVPPKTRNRESLGIITSRKVSSSSNREAPPIQQPPTPSFSIHRAPAPAPLSSIPGKVKETKRKQSVATNQSEDEGSVAAPDLNSTTVRPDTTGRSPNFWNPTSWIRQPSVSNASPHLSTDRSSASAGLLGHHLEKTRSAVSRLSIDDEDGTAADAGMGARREGGKAVVPVGLGLEEEVRCRRCGGKEFRARKVLANPGGETGQKLVCGKCGLICE